MSPPRTAVVAHRGACRVERENTIEAFHRAVEMGAEGIELDVRMTADAVLVVHHDAEVVIGPDGPNVAICALRASDLPAHVPRLEDALSACAGAWVNVEIKNIVGEVDFDLDRKVVDHLVPALAGRSSDDWVISSFDRGTIDKVRALAPHLQTAWLCLRWDATTCADLARDGHQGVSPWEPLITTEMVEVAHSHGLRVAGWTCNDPDRMRELLAWGVDAIITDLPDLALRVRADAPDAPPRGRN